MSAPHVIWIVTGECGAYSDSCWWLVCWRTTEAEAKTVVEVLNREAAEFKEWYRSIASLHTWAARLDAEAQRNLEVTMTDPNFTHDHGEAGYRYQAVADDARALAEEISAASLPTTDQSESGVQIPGIE